jgi:hypothetical protein
MSANRSLALQLFGLVLGFLEQLFEPGAATRRAHGNAEDLGHAGQQLLVLRPHLVQETQLDHRMHDTIG